MGRNIIGNRLKIARTIANISQKDLMARLDFKNIHFSDSKLSAIEAGKYPVKDYELVAIAEELHVSIVWLLGLDKDTGNVPKL